MPPRAEDDAHAALFQQVPGAHHVIEARHLVIDVLHAVPRRREQRHLVVDLVDAQQRRLADAVAHAGAEFLRPEPLVARGIRGAQSDVAETGDARIARREVAAAAVVRPQHQVDAVAARIAEVDEGLDMAVLALRRASGVHVDARVAQLGGRPVQLVGGSQLEAHHVVLGIALEVHERVIPIVAAEIVRAGFGPSELEAEDRSRILVGEREVSRAEPDVTNVVKVDHLKAFGRQCRSGVPIVGKCVASVK